LLPLPAIRIASAEDSSAGVTLRWSPKQGDKLTCNVSSTGTHDGNVLGRTENFTISVGSIAEGKIQFVATGEPVPNNAPLAYRFQRAVFPEFKYTVDPLGNTDSPVGQPFPLFINIPVLPSEPVSEGSTWSGGPIGILPDINAGPIPFTFTSKVESIAEYHGEKCAQIETDYKVALPADAKSLMPFLGLVQGDEPKVPGNGAPIGGVVKDSRANKANIQPGDVIIAAEGQRIRGWGGLKEILPLLVPDKPVKFKVRRGDQELDIEVAPEGIPLVSISAKGGLHSTCFFSLDSGIPLKIDLTSEDLTFTLTNAKGETEEKHASPLHITMDYEREGSGSAG
jgi:hypothetical protein